MDGALSPGPPRTDLARRFDGDNAFAKTQRIVQGVAPPLAVAKPCGAPHSIAELVAHMHWWQEWVLAKAAGAERPIPERAAGGRPGVEEEGWNALAEAFLEGVERCKALALGAPDLGAPFRWGEVGMTLEAALADTAMHNGHHLGQVVLLRQLLGAWPPPEGGSTW